MLESESSALPFGDSPLLSTDDIILQGFEKSKHFFQKFVKNKSHAFGCFFDLDRMKNRDRDKMTDPYDTVVCRQPNMRIKTE